MLKKISYLRYEPDWFVDCFIAVFDNEFSILIGLKI